MQKKTILILVVTVILITGLFYVGYSGSSLQKEPIKLPITMPGGENIAPGVEIVDLRSTTSRAVISQQGEFKSYKSDTYGFGITFPKSFGVYEYPKDKEDMSFLGFMRPCSEYSVVCFADLNAKKISPRFDGVVASVQTFGATTCKNYTGAGQEKIAPVVINGIPFEVYKGGEGATGHTRESITYIASLGEKCYILEAVVGYTTTDFELNGTVVPQLPDQEKAKAFNTLTTILKTFKIN